MLASGFWLIASERFDPHTAKKTIRSYCRRRHLGGLVSALATERVAAIFGVPAMLPLLAAACSSAVPGSSARPPCAPPTARAVATSDEDKAGAPRRSALRVLPDAPYLRNLAALVLLGTTSAALVDYLFKAQAIETFGRGDNLLRFFALVLRRHQPADVRAADVGVARGSRAIRSGRLRRHARPARCSPAASAASSRQVSAACSSRAAANRSSAAPCSAPATSSSTRRFRPPRSGPRRR